MSGRFINPESVWAMRAQNATHYWNLYNEILTRRALEGRLTPEMKAKIEADNGVKLETSHDWRLFEGGVAVIDVMGPMVKRGDWMAEVSGITSYGSLATQLQECLDSESVKSIILCVDSPGGEVYGCQELAQMIYNARGIKPLATYVEGDMASAALWIGTSTSHVRMAPLSEAGSLGVVYGLADTSKMGDKTGIQIVEVVSPQSPFKRIDFTNDKAKKEGIDRIRVRAADMCDKFGEAMARNRGVTKSAAFRNFGRGNMMISDKAVEVGIADDIGTFDDLVSVMASGSLPGQKKVAVQGNKPAKTSPINGQGENDMRLSFLNRGARATEGEKDELDEFEPTVPVEDAANTDEDDNQGVEETISPNAMAYIQQLESVIAENNLTVDGQAVTVSSPALLAQERAGFMAVARKKITPAQAARTEKLFAAAQEGVLTPSMLHSYFSKMDDHGSLQRMDLQALRRPAAATVTVPAVATAGNASAESNGNAGYAQGTRPAEVPLSSDEAIEEEARKQARAAAERMNGTQNK